MIGNRKAMAKPSRKPTADIVPSIKPHAAKARLSKNANLAKPVKPVKPVNHASGHPMNHASVRP